MADVFVLNSGYRTRYPHVAVATNRPAGREGGAALKGRHDRIYRYTSTANEPCLLLLWRTWEYQNKRDLGLIFKSTVSVCRQNGQTIRTSTRFLDDLGNQSEKSERCLSSHERVSGEPSHGLGLVFPILRTLIGWFPRTAAVQPPHSVNHGNLGEWVQYKPRIDARSRQPRSIHSIGSRVREPHVAVATEDRRGCERPGGHGSAHGCRSWWCSRPGGPAAPGSFGCPAHAPAGESRYLAEGQRGGATRSVNTYGSWLLWSPQSQQPPASPPSAPHSDRVGAAPGCKLPGPCQRVG